MQLKSPAWKAAAIVAVTAGTAALVAGPLTPPSGGVASTYKTLNEVRPETPVQSLPGSEDAVYVISQPGSYYLTGSVAGAPDKAGIKITANDVTLDLCGFTLDGGGVGTDAIQAGATPISGLTVRNGGLVNWTHAGLYGAGSTGMLVENLRTRDTGLHGVSCGAGSVVRECAFKGGQNGLYAATGTQVVDCSATNIGYTSFIFDDGCSATRCASYNPALEGFLGTGSNCLIVDCIARGGSVGIQVNTGSRVERCKVGNVWMGIVAESGNTIVDNTANADTAGVGYGVVLHYGANVIQGNHIYAFEQGITLYNGTSTNVAFGNTIHSCTHPINPLDGWGHPMVEPTVTSAAGLAANPVANIAQ